MYMDLKDRFSPYLKNMVLTTIQWIFAPLPAGKGRWMVNSWKPTATLSFISSGGRSGPGDAQEITEV